MPLSNLLNKIPKPGQLGANQNGPRSIQKGKSFNKKLAVRGSLVIALVAGFFVLTSHADTNCRELTFAPYSSGECVQKLKVMVNKVSGSNLDVNNPGFDGELNNQLIRMEALGAFLPHHYNNQQWVWMGVWDVTNQHYNEAIDKDNAAAAAAAAAAAQKAAEEAAAPPAPAPAVVPCREQNLTPFSSGDCVKVLKAAVNYISGSNLDPGNPGFDGNLHQQLLNMDKFNAFTPYHYTDKVTPEIFDKIVALGEAKAAAPAPAAAAVTPPPAPVTKPCREQDLTPFSSGPCVRIIKAMVNYISGSKLDENNEGFDGTLHQQLLNVDKYGTFSPNHYTDKVTTAIYDSLVAAVDAKKSAPSAPPAVLPPSPAADQDCDNAGLQLGSHGNCVRYLHAMLNQAGATQVNSGMDTFNDTTSIVIKFVMNTGGVKGVEKGSFTGVVTKPIWDGLAQLAREKQTKQPSLLETGIKAVTTKIGIGVKDAANGSISSEPIACPHTLTDYQKLTSSQKERISNKADCATFWMKVALQQIGAVTGAGNQPASGAGKLAGTTAATNVSTQTAQAVQAAQVAAQTIAATTSGDYNALVGLKKITKVATFYSVVIDPNNKGMVARPDLMNETDMRYWAKSKPERLVGGCRIALYPGSNNATFWTYTNNACVTRENKATTAKELRVYTLDVTTLFNAVASPRATNLSYGTN